MLCFVELMDLVHSLGIVFDALSIVQCYWNKKDGRKS